MVKKYVKSDGKIYIENLHGAKVPFHQAAVLLLRRFVKYGVALCSHSTWHQTYEISQLEAISYIFTVKKLSC